MNRNELDQRPNTSDTTGAAGAHPLAGRQLCVTGRLASMTHETAAQQVEALGGHFVKRPGDETDMLVIGQNGWPFKEDGRMSESLERAQELRSNGAKLSVISEQRFLELLSGQEESDEGRFFTTAQLAKILKIPASRIRVWVRKGLIAPQRTRLRLDTFDFRQVAQVKMLHRLLESGVPLQTVRRSLEQLQTWLPDADSSLTQLSSWEADGSLIVRLEDGALAEPSGQLRFGFEDAGERPAPTKVTRVEGGEPARSAESWFEEAIRCEETENYADAAVAYEKALLHGGPRPEIAFNLGNVLYMLGRLGEARGRYLQALEMERDYVEAWNNLASVLAELGQWEQAIDAGRRAVKLAPDYPDAHYNLAEILFACGREDEAGVHARRYLKHDPFSEWARQMRERLDTDDEPQ